MSHSTATLAYPTAVNGRKCRYSGAFFGLCSDFSCSYYSLKYFDLACSAFDSTILRKCHVGATVVSPYCLTPLNLHMSFYQCKQVRNNISECNLNLKRPLTTINRIISSRDLAEAHHISTERVDIETRTDTMPSEKPTKDKDKSKVHKLSLKGSARLVAEFVRCSFS